MIFLPIVIPLLGLTAFFWALAPASWHPVFLLVFVLVGGWILYAAVLKLIRNEKVVARTSRPLDIHRWQPEWDGAYFLNQFSLFLRARGWRIVSASTPGPNRALVVADKTKSRSRIALLCVRPGDAPQDADFQGLDAARKEERAARGALVIEPKPSAEQMGAALERGCVVLRFVDLAFMEEALQVVEER